MEAITREEKLMSGQQLEPITRKELFLAKAAGMDVQTPEPITREEMFLSQISGGGGGATPAVVEPLSVTQNGTYTAPEGVDGYSPVTVNVASSGGEKVDWFNDGDTHIWITLGEGRTSPVLGVCPNGTVTVDWGDGTEPDVLTGTSISTVTWTPTHNYAKPGDYIITLSVDGEMGLTGDSNRYGYLLCYNTSGDDRSVAYKGAISKLELGGHVTYIGDNALRSLAGLKSLLIHNGVTSIGSNAIRECYGLVSVVLPSSLTSIGDYGLSMCRTLTSVVMPSSLTSIGGGTFSSCNSLKFCDFSAHEVVPTVGNYVFNNTPTDLEIRVPAARYNEWIAATNWANYASKIVAV